jgi:hypothetical protein
MVPVRQFIGEALPNDTTKRHVRARKIVHALRFSVVVAELELCRITMKMTFTAVLVDALHAALEDAEIAFHRVRVNVATDILASLVGGEVMVSKGATDARVLLGFVGVERCFLGHVVADDRHQSGHFQIIHNHAFCLASGAVNKGQHFHLVMVCRAFDAARFAANEGFVNLDNATARAKARKGIVAHGFTDTVGHEPCRFQGHAKGAVQLVAGNALLACAHQIDGLQPQVHGNMAAFKDGADFDGKRLAASIAFPQADAGRLAAHLAAFAHNAAMRANPATRPDARFDIGVSGFFIVEFGAGQNGHDNLFAMS